MTKAHLWISFFNLFAQIAYGKESIELPKPQAKDALITLDQGVRSVYVDLSSIWHVLSDFQTLVKTPLHADLNSLPLSKSLRIPLPRVPLREGDEGFSSLAPKAWHSLYMSGNGQLVVADGETFQAIALSPGKDRWMEKRRQTFPWDLIKPADDSRGEPPQFEINRLRAAFAKEYQAQKGLRWHGFAPYQEGHAAFLGFSLLPSFPLLEIGCSEEEPERCEVRRACEFKKDPERPLDIGFGVDKTHQGKIFYLIGSSIKHRIYVYEFHSCFASIFRYEIKLPSQLKELSSFTVDTEGTLWIGTRAPDDYLNSSIYRFSHDLWHHEPISQRRSH